MQILVAGRTSGVVSIKETKWNYNDDKEMGVFSVCANWCRLQFCVLVLICSFLPDTQFFVAVLQFLSTEG